MQRDANSLDHKTPSESNTLFWFVGDAVDKSSDLNAITRIHVNCAGATICVLKYHNSIAGDLAVALFRQLQASNDRTTMASQLIYLPRTQVSGHAFTNAELLRRSTHWDEDNVAITNTLSKINRKEQVAPPTALLRKANTDRGHRSEKIFGYLIEIIHEFCAKTLEADVK